MAAWKVPPLYSESALRALTAGRTFHELGPISNVCADWGMILSEGLFARMQTALSTRERMHSDATAVEFLDCAIEAIDAVIGLARYAAAARKCGREDVAVILDQVPAFPARTFHEALQSLRICHSVLWLSGHYHCGLGRLDQYLWPYLCDDVEAGRLDYPAAGELLAEFFISLNKDSDLYPGIQQGDNGQSLMLGGVRRDGIDGVNPLTALVLHVACVVALIDPKINLPVSHDTDIELLTLAARLTRLGLGFPQFSNDDVVIPGLVAAGYEIEDARDYSVAACWEFIVPGRGMEVVNIGAASMPSAVDLAIREGLAAGKTFEGILDRVQFHLAEQVKKLAARSRKLLLPAAPYYSVLMDGCLETGRDLSAGLKYNNFGIHGAASANAADALAAVKEFVFDKQSVEPFRLLLALENNFANDEELRLRLREKAPKVGNNDDRADQWLVALFEMFAQACEAAGENGRGGRYRPGSGSAMYYIWLATGHEGMQEPVVGATADGRKFGEFFSSSWLRHPTSLCKGP